MTPEIAITACSILLIFGITPGPSTVRAATISISEGIGVGLWFAVGVGIGYAGILLICGGLLETSQAFSPKVVLVQKLLGIALVCWTSFKILMAKPSQNQPLTAQVARGTCKHAVVLQFVNPKAWVTGFIVMEGAHSSAGSEVLIWWVLPVLCFVILSLSVVIWVLAAASLRPLLCNGLRFRMFHTAMGLGLMGTLLPVIGI